MEKPPVEIVVRAWATASNVCIPEIIYDTMQARVKTRYIRPIELASCAVLGRTFSLSESSARKICIPPTLRNGSTDIAMMMIPIPPSHCRIARQRRIPGGAVSRPVMTVEPVVVIPDMASKKESVKFKSIALILKGSDAKRASEHHTEVIKRKACLTLTFLTWLALLRISDPPKNAVMMMHRRNTFQSECPK